MHYKEVVMSPEDDNQFQDTDKMQRRFINKQRGPIKSNGNISNKRGAVSFNIGRIIPRNINHDKQYLYEQNIKLKEQIQQFREQMTKLKTRLTASQKQKHKIVDQFNHSQFPMKNGSSRVVKRNSSMVYSSLQNQTYLKKMLRQTKDEVTILKNQNTRLKKTVKYTQISQLQIQNKYLIQQCQRLGEIIQSKVLDQNQFVEQYQRKIEQLKQQLQYQRNNNKMLSNQAKKKYQQLEDLKADIAVVTNRQKKLKKQLADYKKTARNQRDSSHSRKLVNHGESFQKFCQNCRVLTKQLKSCQQKITHILKAKQQQTKNAKKASQHTEQKQSKKDSIVKVDVDHGKIQKKENQMKILKSQQNYQNQNQNFNNQENGQAQEQYSDDYFDKESKQQKQQPQQKPTQPNQKTKNQQKQSNDQYEGQFDQIQNNQGSEKQEVLFTKQPSKQIQKQPTKQKQKLKTKQKKEEQKSFQQILKQTITYRMMSQRYTYNDLAGDIKQSGMQQFTLQQLAGMLNDQPFFLTQDQLQQVLTHIFGHTDLDIDDKIKAKQFLKRLKTYFIGDINLIQEDKEQELLHQCAQKLKKNKKKLKKKFQQNSQEGTIQKSLFSKILKQSQFEEYEIQLLLGEASLFSKTLQQINYNELLNKLSQ